MICEPLLSSTHHAPTPPTMALYKAHPHHGLATSGCVFFVQGLVGGWGGMGGMGRGTMKVGAHNELRDEQVGLGESKLLDTQ